MWGGSVRARAEGCGCVRAFEMRLTIEGRAMDPANRTRRGGVREDRGGTVAALSSSRVLVCVSDVLVPHSLTRKADYFPAVVVFCVTKLLGFNGKGTVGTGKENRHASRRARSII